MKLTTLTKITRAIICSAAVALAIGGFLYNPAHIVTGAILFAIGVNVEWVKEEDLL